MKILLGLSLLFSVASYSQFPNVDSLRMYMKSHAKKIDSTKRYITNTGPNQFTNFRLNKIIHAITNYYDSIRKEPLPWDKTLQKLKP